MADVIEQGVHTYSAEEGYVPPTQPEVCRHLEWFKDQKLALMMHFGLYAQLGIVASWALCGEAQNWARQENDGMAPTGTAFQKQYFGLKRTFNPIRMQPDEWADLAARNGFRYLIFTTKHHDGFCLFDTKQTDFKTTDAECPFHTHPCADVTRSVFDAFRARGMGIGAYFSKPDWHCPWYWAEGMEKPVGATKNPTYTPEQHPELWEKFVRFTHNQMMELLTGYGKIDILWLDGGQVNPHISQREPNTPDQDIRMDELVAQARKSQPGLIVVDRTVGGANENYITPEGVVPDHRIAVPWESCVPLGRDFNYIFDDDYKSPRELVQLLVDVICRGGNLALNVSPQPDGRLPDRAVRSLDGLGAWLRSNGEAVYGTRPCAPYFAGRISYTQSKDQKSRYAFYAVREGEKLGKTVVLPLAETPKHVELLDGGERPFKRVKVDSPEFHAKGLHEGVEVSLPTWLEEACPLTLAFKVEMD